jgi:hypothetical protein
MLEAILFDKRPPRMLQYWLHNFLHTLQHLEAHAYSAAAQLSKRSNSRGHMREKWQSIHDASDIRSEHTIQFKKFRVRMKIDTPFVFSSKQHGCIIALGQGHRLPADGTAPSRQFESKNSLKCYGLLNPKWHGGGDIVRLQG